jgi:hypothetical protein
MDCRVAPGNDERVKGESMSRKYIPVEESFRWWEKDAAFRRAY